MWAVNGWILILEGLRVQASSNCCIWKWAFGKQFSWTRLPGGAPEGHRRRACSVSLCFLAHHGIIPPHPRQIPTNGVTHLGLWTPKTLSWNKPASFPRKLLSGTLVVLPKGWLIHFPVSLGFLRISQCCCVNASSGSSNGFSIIFRKNRWNS